jgi:hypothetical protein
MKAWPLCSALSFVFALVAGQAAAQISRQQSLDVDSRAEFASLAHEATARFQDKATAIGEGYRQIGPDFPTLGQHWVNMSILFTGLFDPARPSVLAYADIGGKPTLVKVAYALPIGATETVPDFPWAAGAWQYLDGNVAEAGLPSDGTSAGATAGGLRVAVLHAWIWLENPLGALAMHNWALPFRRLDLTSPSATNPAAAHALGLVTGGASYYRKVLLALGQPSATEVAEIDELIEDHRRKVDDWLSLHASSASLSANDVAPLAAIWQSLQTSILERVGSATRARLRSLFARLNAGETAAPG